MQCICRKCVHDISKRNDRGKVIVERNYSREKKYKDEKKIEMSLKIKSAAKGDSEGSFLEGSCEDGFADNNGEGESVEVKQEQSKKCGCQVGKLSEKG